jgi:hypothetical protein
VGPALRAGLETNLLDYARARARPAYAAIADAQCRGALVIAAAGNGPTVVRTRSRTAPARRMGAAARTDAGRLHGVTSRHDAARDLPARARYATLRYAVAGVKGDGSKLDNARVDSEPKLVAYGDSCGCRGCRRRAHGDAHGQLGRGTRRVVDGACRMVSSRIASCRRCSSKPYDVRDRVYDSGASVGRFANFCVGGTPTDSCPGVGPEVHEARICDVVDFITGSNNLSRH